MAPSPAAAAPVDTIAAIATAPGAGGVGIVRISGPAAAQIAHALCRIKPQPRHAHLARFRDAAGDTIDHGVLLYFAAPASYTGEHVVELQGHGSRVVLQCLLERCIALGARLARPGEFSERAFLNGKLDLAQAEAVADLVSASSEAAARAAIRSLEGLFSQQVHALVEQVTRLRVHVEAAIDFPEEEIDFLADRAILQALQHITTNHAELLAAARHGQRLRDGVHVAILGPPNAGKSSLLNALAGSERAIVTATAGTTRDVLREAVRIDDVEILLADTAGLRAHTDDAIEREGMRRARAEQARADLLLMVIEDGDAEAEQALRNELARLGDSALATSTVWVHNKCDRSGRPAGLIGHANECHLALSAKTGAGLDELRRLLREHAGGGSCDAGTFSARRRHVDALQRAGHGLAGAAEQLRRGAGELLAEDLRSVQHALGEITGVVDADALLGEIFSSFCIGK